ncbi:hypothetical protein FRC03_011085 [Tulasnella sp. 419]|nr:hypothetical protein FRC03_011085 [Tulasnella sp. 419]
MLTDPFQGPPSVVKPSSKRVRKRTSDIDNASKRRKTDSSLQVATTPQEPSDNAVEFSIQLGPHNETQVAPYLHLESLRTQHLENSADSHQHLQKEDPDLQSHPPHPPQPHTPPLPPVKRKRKRFRLPREENCAFCQGTDLSNKSGVIEEMATCINCGGSGHPSCMNIEKIADVIHNYDWLCMECKLCEICNRGGWDAKLMLFCDKCDRGWHTYCLDPPLSKPPEGDWVCPMCQNQDVKLKDPPLPSVRRPKSKKTSADPQPVVRKKPPAAKKGRSQTRSRSSLDRATEAVGPSSSQPSPSPSRSTSHYDRTDKSRDYPLTDFGAPDLTGCWTKFGDVPFVTGGNSDIYKARLERSQQAEEMQIIAVKVLRSIRIRPDCVPEEILRKRLMREMRVWSQLQHSNIVPFLGYAFSGSFPCMIAPWYENGNAPEYIARTPDADRTQLVLDSINGLVHLHSRDPPIVHGDLKATNILIDNKGHARITDFGLSRILEEGPSGLTTSTGVIGTHRWMAPELMLKERTRPTTAADIYSMTLLALEIYTGKIPFAHLDQVPFFMAIVANSSPERSHYRPFNPPEDLWRIFESGWSFEPSQRPDADNLKEEFERALASTSWR